MKGIVLAGQDIENNYKNETIFHSNHQEIGKYTDHGQNFNNKGWDNWQSILYPFWENPAYTGSESRFNISLDQKIDMVPEVKSTNYKTNVGFDARLPFGIGAGIYYNAVQTQFSLQTTFGAALSKILFQKGTSALKIGASLSYMSNSLYYNSLNYPDQFTIWGPIKATSEKDPLETTKTLGINGGLWYSNNHILAGLDISNINEPRPHHLEEAAPIPRLYRATAGYRFSTGNVQWLPMVELRRQNDINQANTNLTAVYKDKAMVTVAYQDISPKTGRGNLFVYLGYNFSNKVRVFAGAGYNTEWQDIGVNEYFVHCGVKYQIH
jgi:hypothetical protein